MLIIHRNNILQRLSTVRTNSCNFHIISKIFNKQILTCSFDQRKGLSVLNLFRKCNKLCVFANGHLNFSTFSFKQLPICCEKPPNSRKVWNHFPRVVLDNCMLNQGTIKGFCSISNTDHSHRSQAAKSNLFDFDEKVRKSPKNVLHNMFDIIAKEKNVHGIKLQPSFTSTKGKNNTNSWTCTYNIKWPESMKFTATAQTKQQASHKAALSVLHWLKTAKKVTKDGSPVLFDRKEGEQLMNKSILTLSLKKETIAKMNHIKDALNRKFVSLLSENLNEQTSQTTRTLDSLERDNIHFNIEKRILQKMRYFGPNRKELPISAYRYILFLSTS